MIIPVRVRPRLNIHRHELDAYPYIMETHMIGSGDRTDIRDTMVNHSMTLLEAVLYHAILTYEGPGHYTDEAADKARHYAKYIIEHLPPEIPNASPPQAHDDQQTGAGSHGRTKSEKN